MIVKVAMLTIINFNDFIQMFSPGKVSSCRPFAIGVYFCAHGQYISVPDTVQTSSNKQGLFETQKKDNWTTFGYFHLLAVREKARAAVVISRCGQVRKGFQVFAFRVVPGTERG